MSQLFLMLFACQLVYLNKIENNPNHYSQSVNAPNKFIARVSTIPVENENSVKAQLQLKYLVKGKKLCESMGTVIAYFTKDDYSKIKYGDFLFVNSQTMEIEPPKNPGDFNYKEYLKNKNIFHSVYVKHNQFRKLNLKSDFTIREIATKVKIKMIKLFREKFKSKEEFSIIAALLVGYDDEINRDLADAYAATGTIHVLSVSGLHIGIIYALLNYLFIFLEKIKFGKYFKFILILSGLWIFALISGLSPSVVRASLMCSLFLFGNLIYRKSQPINTLLASAFLILLYNPLLIFDVGFQLSYLALLGILIFQPAMQKWFYFKSGFLNKVWTLTSVSLAAQLTTFPITLYYFNNFSLIFIIANLLIIPLSTIVMYGGLLILIVSPFNQISTFFSDALGFIIRCMNFITINLGQFPGAQINCVFINLFEVLVIFIIVFFISAYFLERRKENLFASLIFISILLISLNLKYLYESEQKGFIVYHDKKNTSIDFISGFNALSVGQENNSSKRYKRSKHISNSKNFKLSSNIVICVSGKRLLMVNNQKIKHSKKIDYLILNGNPIVSLEKLHQDFPDAEIISDATNKFSKNLRWSLMADSLNLRYWSIRDDGAFIKQE